MGQILCAHRGCFPPPSQAAGRHPKHTRHTLPALSTGTSCSSTAQATPVLCILAFHELHPEGREFSLPSTASSHTTRWKQAWEHSLMTHWYLCISYIPTYFIRAYKYHSLNLFVLRNPPFFIIIIISVYGTDKKPLWFPLRSGMDLLMQHHQPKAQHWILMGRHQGIQEMQTEPMNCLKGF